VSIKLTYYYLPACATAGFVAVTAGLGFVATGAGAVIVTFLVAGAAFLITGLVSAFVSEVVSDAPFVVSVVESLLPSVDAFAASVALLLPLLSGDFDVRDADDPEATATIACFEENNIF
jgi:hypothetical protein